ncbi:hypothetical protein HFP57_13405 [Parasphingopyxis algicola]|uniref:hypothetical protein n=1 Tax=Parasphingopyxis algicola TaxID=2026624 RepID=UPI00159F9708|nr:hypothetical protein [Parasphingopyxis algicola]QLC25922.1 hypothetical protein HFP57_13405 [Parasphingopyxis algicola]
MSKLVIDLRSGTIDVEGEQEFVEIVYADMKDLAISRFGELPLDAPGQVPQSDQKLPKTKTSKPVRNRKTGGPSCASRIEVLKEESFFDEPRSPAAIREKLAEKGATYESKNIAAALTNLTKAGKLRRFKDDGHWMYQNP